MDLLLSGQSFVSTVFIDYISILLILDIRKLGSGFLFCFKSTFPTKHQASLLKVLKLIQTQTK